MEPRHVVQARRVLAVGWVTVISLVFFCPFFVPWNKWETANLTLPVVGGIGVVVALWWVVSAKKYFKGPKVQGSRDELLAIERELESLGG